MLILKHPYQMAVNHLVWCQVDTLLVSLPMDMQILQEEACLVDWYRARFLHAYTHHRALVLHANACSSEMILLTTQNMKVVLCDHIHPGSYIRSLRMIETANEPCGWALDRRH